MPLTPLCLGARLAQPLETEMNGQLERDSNGKTRSGTSTMTRRRISRLASSLHFGKKARFYRVFFENRFKQRNLQRP
jgi:hypothetical protein